MSTDLSRLLADRFNAAAASGLDLSVGFRWGGRDAGNCRFRIRNGTITESDTSSVDFTLHFASAEILKSIVLGDANAMAHFLNGEFRSDGGVPLVFPTLRAFSGQVDSKSRYKVIDQPS